MTPGISLGELFVAHFIPMFLIPGTFIPTNIKYLLLIVVAPN